MDGRLPQFPGMPEEIQFSIFNNIRFLICSGPGWQSKDPPTGTSSSVQTGHLDG